MTVDIESRLLMVFQSVFGEEISSISDSDELDGIPGWDSAGHLNLIMAIEADFEVQFDVEEMGSLTTVAAIRQRLTVA